MDQWIRDDSFEIMPRIPDSSIDLIYTDPPYLISGHGKLFVDYRNGKHGDINLDFGDWDYDFRLEEFLQESYRVLVDQGSAIVWTSEQLFGQYRHEAIRIGFDVKQLLVWVKTNPIPQFRKVGYRQTSELMIWLMKGKNSRANPNFIFQTQREMKNVFEHPIVGGNERLKWVSEGERRTHPTQKPLKICRQIVRTHCRAGGVVLDPFAGVGTIPLAAQLEGREYIGIEIDPEYYTVGSERLNSSLEAWGH